MDRETLAKYEAELRYSRAIGLVMLLIGFGIGAALIQLLTWLTNRGQP
jgi:hypothetical protein